MRSRSREQSSTFYFRRRWMDRKDPSIDESPSQGILDLTAPGPSGGSGQGPDLAINQATAAFGEAKRCVRQFARRNADIQRPPTPEIGSLPRPSGIGREYALGRIAVLRTLARFNARAQVAGIAPASCCPLPIRFRSVRRFPRHHRLQYPGTSQLTQVLDGRGATERHAGFWCAGKSRSPLSCASCACHRLRDQGQ